MCAPDGPLTVLRRVGVGHHAELPHGIDAQQVPAGTARRNRELARPGILHPVQQEEILARPPPGHAISWRALLGRLWRLHRLNVFDRRDGDADFLKFKELLRPGQVFVEGVSSPFSLRDASRGVYGEAAGEWTAADARGFSRIVSLPGELYARMARTPGAGGVS